LQRDDIGLQALNLGEELSRAIGVPKSIEI
jgi:hypothetical protein